jgi:hypothetical protein
MSQPLPAAALEPISGANLPVDLLIAPHAPRRLDNEIEQAYQDIVRVPRYFQFANIPDRIIRCLELSGVRCQRETVRRRLQAYSLFIGVVDDELECANNDLGTTILNRLANPQPRFDGGTKNSRAEFMTEILKRQILPMIHSLVMRKFRRLHSVADQERHAVTMRTYIKKRRLVGRLTAELSYLLIRDDLSGDSTQLVALMKDVGAVGCLLDSVVDARADVRAGLWSFRPTIFDSLFLCTTTVMLGLRVTVKHLRMIPLFIEGIRDNFRDRRRSNPQITQITQN